MDNIKFFKTPQALRTWFLKYAANKTELWAGFYKVDSGKKGISYKEAVDEALCFGWIDGIRKKVDEESYANRFTPRKKNSVWSNVNTKRVQELIDEGRMQEQGLKAFEARDEKRAGLYSFENELQLTPAFIRKFRANKKAWAHFSSRPPGYKRTSIHWVMSAKQETTRQRRLGILIANSENGRPIPLLDRGEKK